MVAFALSFKNGWWLTGIICRLQRRTQKQCATEFEFCLLLLVLLLRECAVKKPGC